jgi:cytoskeletal protein CcmA (bactofilin family)
LTPIRRVGSVVGEPLRTTLGPADNGVIVGEDIRINGAIEGREDLVVRGRVEGAVRIEGVLTVEPGAWVLAEVTARRALIQGTVRGNVTATEAIEVARTGRMVGDAVAPQVTIVAGAGFRGRVEMGDPDSDSSEEPVAPAPPAARTIPPLARPRGALRRRAES